MAFVTFSSHNRVDFLCRLYHNVYPLQSTVNREFTERRLGSLV